MRLGDIYKISKGKKAPDFGDVFFSGAERFIQIDDLRNDDNMKYCQDDLKLVKCKADDILIAWDGANAGTIGYGLKGIIGSTLAKLVTTRKDVHTAYVGHFLKSKFKYLRDRCTGATIPHISKQVLTDLEIPLPPLEEQKRIAEVLDKADRLRQKDRQLLAYCDQLLQSIFLDMFGDPVKNKKEWEVKMLQDVVQPGKIVTYGIVQAGPHVEGGIPYIKTGDIKNGKIVVDGLNRTSQQIANNYKRSEVSEGDIVMSIRATVGTVALVPAELHGANLTQGTARIAAGPSVDNLYLFDYLQTDGVQRWIQQQVKGATFREITLTKLRELPVVIPPINLQQKFGEISKYVENQKSLIIKNLQYSDSLFQSLLQKAFKGELQLKDNKVAEEVSVKPKFIISSIL